jgi:hypothetical protein
MNDSRARGDEARPVLPRKPSARHAAADEHTGFRGGLRRALPEVALMGLVGGTLIAAVGALGAPIGLVLLAGAACVTLVVAFLLLVRRVPRRSTRPRRKGQPSAARFSRSPYAPVLLFGIAALVAVGAYFVADPHLTRGRHGAAAIMCVVLAPILTVIALYDPLSSLIDRWLDRRATMRSAVAAHGDRGRGSDSDEER